MGVVITKPEFHAGQLEILNSDARYKVASCGRRFGKSMVICYWLGMDDGSAISGNPVAYFAPTYKIMLDVWNKLIYLLKPIIKKANRTDGRITLITGGWIDFWSLEDENAGRSRKYARIAVDEAAFVRNLLKIWQHSIEPTLVDMRGEGWFFSSPKGMNDFNILFKRGSDPNYPDWQSFQMPSIANPFIPLEEIENKKLELPSLIFSQEYLGEFVIFGSGLVKPDHIIYSKAPAQNQIVLGVDLAISLKNTADWTAIVAMSRNPVTGIVYIHEVERHRCEFSQVISRIKEAAARHNPIMIVIEQVQYQAAVIQELARTTRLPIRGIHPDKDKFTRFAPLLTRYEQGLVRHNESMVPAWFREELLAFPNGTNDDAVDAAAYAFSALPEKLNAEFKPVTKMGMWKDY